jgi:hypothetical protein
VLTKDQILTTLSRRTQSVRSELLGGELCIREHSRAEFRAIQQGAADPDDTERLLTDRWNGGLFANAVIDPASGAPLFTLEELLAFPERNALWAEIKRIAQLSLDLSEVGPAALTKSDPATDQG